MSCLISPATARRLRIYNGAYTVKIKWAGLINVVGGVQTKQVLKLIKISILLSALESFDETSHIILGE